MTREEAKQWLEAMKSAYALPIETYEAIDMAIEALHREEAEEKGYCHRIRPKGERREP